MLQYHNEKIPASDPIPIRLSDAKLRQIQPELYGPQSADVEMQRGKRVLGNETGEMGNETGEMKLGRS
jgi:hypothetical protein